MKICAENSDVYLAFTYLLLCLICRYIFKLLSIKKNLAYFENKQNSFLVSLNQTNYAQN